jgi:hypothetical protein
MICRVAVDFGGQASMYGTFEAAVHTVEQIAAGFGVTGSIHRHLANLPAERSSPRIL